MPSPTKGARLGGSPAHQRLMLANLATSLFTHGRITTTEAKAKRLRPFAERLISKARKADLHNRREVMKVIRDKDVVHRLFAEIGPFYVDRPGGYTRITKTMPRKGDNAPMAVIELVTEQTVTAEAEAARRGRSAKDTRRDTAGATTAAGTAEDTADEAPADEADETPADEVDAELPTEESASTDDSPYGEGSHAPLEDGSQPDGFPIKGDEDANVYHVAGSPSYDDVSADVWFASEAAAEASGFTAAPQDTEDDGD